MKFKQILSSCLMLLLSTGCWKIMLGLSDSNWGGSRIFCLLDISEVGRGVKQYKYGILWLHYPCDLLHLVCITSAFAFFKYVLLLLLHFLNIFYFCFCIFLIFLFPCFVYYIRYYCFYVLFYLPYCSRFDTAAVDDVINVGGMRHFRKVGGVVK